MALQITIDQNEIETAIKNHIGTLLTINDGQNVTIDLKAGRGENGFSATIEIGGTVTATVAPTLNEAAPSISGPFKRQAAAKAQPAVETAPAAAQAEPEAVTAAEPDPVATAGDDVGLEEAKPKTGLFAHLGNRTGTDKAAE